MEEPFIGASRVAFLAENNQPFSRPSRDGRQNFVSLPRAMEMYEERKQKTEEQLAALRRDGAMFKEVARQAKYDNDRLQPNFNFDKKRRHEQFSKFGDPFNWSSDPANRFPEQFERIQGTFDPKYMWMLKDRFNEVPRFDYTKDAP